MLFLLKRTKCRVDIIHKRVEQENSDSNVIVCLLSSFTATIIILNPIIGSG
jgi:hypothetical protein